MSTESRSAAPDSVEVIAVAPLLWAVYDSERPDADAAIGHIDSDGDRFRVGLAGDDLEPYTFGTLRECSQWFAEYCSALSLGCSHGDSARIIR
jgi:hypothetical protein